eukprot:scaffold73855_cov63-Phaeocystis_antarctica.AAC.4
MDSSAQRKQRPRPARSEQRGWCAVHNRLGLQEQVGCHKLAPGLVGQSEASEAAESGPLQHRVDQLRRQGPKVQGRRGCHTGARRAAAPRSDRHARPRVSRARARSATPRAKVI